MNTGTLNLHKHFKKTAGSDYLVGNDLEVLYEPLERGFLEDDIDFGRKLDSVMDEGEIEEKRMFKCEICGKEWFKKALRNETQKWQSFVRKSFKVNSK